MGDARNKIEKEIRAAEHAAFLAKHYPPTPTLPPQRCRCGFTYHDVPRMWVITPGMSKDMPRGGVFCHACCPADLLFEIMGYIAKMPNDA